VVGAALGLSMRLMSRACVRSVVCCQLLHSVGEPFGFFMVSSLTEPGDFVVQSLELPVAGVPLQPPSVPLEFCVPRLQAVKLTSDFVGLVGITAVPFFEFVELSV
jgi:hypothetical protein